MASAPKRQVIPPAVEAQRMTRYSVLLMIGAFFLVGLNLAELTPSRLFWFGAILLGDIGIVVGATSVVLRGLQWHYDRLAEELRGHARTTSSEVSGVVRPAAAAESGAQPPKPE